MESMREQEIKKCKHPKENKLFGFGVIITAIILAIIFGGSFFRSEVINMVKDEMVLDYEKRDDAEVGLSREEILKKLSDDDKELIDIMESYYYWYIVTLTPLAFFLLILFLIGKIYGGVRGNSVRLDEKQYPEVYKIFSEMAQELGFEKIPELYLVNGNGTLNAYATCVPGVRNFAAIYSDILERCLRNNDLESLKFILGHELGHIKFNHVKWWYMFLTIWMNFPIVNYFFGLPISRAKEYGCDKLGEKLSKDSTGRPLMMLSAGKYAYRDIDLEKYMEEHFERGGFWAWLANLGQGHGIISWRIAAIRKKHHAGLIFRNKKEKVIED